MAEPVTDAVVGAARDGDGAAFATIFRALAPSVAGYLAAKGVSDSESVCSDVFVAVFHRLPSVRGGAAGLKTFVFSVAHARVVDDFRRKQRQPSSVEYRPEYDGRVSASAETEAITSLGTAEALALLGQLSDEQREVLTLRVIGDLTVEQVASIMDKSAGAVKQLQRRALLALRQRVTEARNPMPNRFDNQY